VLVPYYPQQQQSQGGGLSGNFGGGSGNGSGYKSGFPSGSDGSQSSSIIDAIDSGNYSGSQLASLESVLNEQDGYGYDGSLSPSIISDSAYTSLGENAPLLPSPSGLPSLDVSQNDVSGASGDGLSASDYLTNFFNSLFGPPSTQTSDLSIPSTSGTPGSGYYDTSGLSNLAEADDIATEVADGSGDDYSGGTDTASYQGSSFDEGGASESPADDSSDDFNGSQGDYASSGDTSDGGYSSGGDDQEDS
jgi:hypothetical protein